MWWRVGKSAIWAYGVLFMTAVGGLLGAQLAGLIGAMVFPSDHTGVQAQAWIHGGWYAGTLLAFVGAVTGRLRFISGGSVVRPTKAGKQATESSPEPPTPPAPEPNRRRTQPTGVLRAAGTLGLIGGFVGMFFGCSLLVFWFSLTYSPYAPKTWRSSVAVKMDRTRPGEPRRPVMTTSHPVALGLVAVPAALGATAGIVGGGLAAALGQVRDG